jgi:hypothetical protein
MVPAMKPGEDVSASFAPVKIGLIAAIHQYGADAGKTFELVDYEIRRVPL